MAKQVSIRSRKSDSSSILGDVLAVAARASIQVVKLDQVRLSASNPRRVFDEASLRQLALSIQEDDLLEPLVVREMQEGYELIAGERRYRALQMLGKKEAECKVLRDVSDDKALTLSLVENLNREDLSPIDELDAVLMLAKIQLQLGSTQEIIEAIKAVRNYERSGTLTEGITQDTLSTLQTLFQRIGISSISSFVANRLPLLAMPHDALEAVREGRITLTHAREIAKVPDSQERARLIERVASGDVSSRDLAGVVRDLLAAVSPQLTEEEGRIKAVRAHLTPKRISALPAKQRVRVSKLLAELENLLL